MTKPLFSGVVLFVLWVWGCRQVDAGIILTANSAGSEMSAVAGVTTETFDSFAKGQYTSLNTAIGTLTSPGMEIVGADQYGGAGGTGNYFAVGVESGQTTATLMLNSPQAYFGFYWSAADSLNQMAFYSNGQLIGVFTAAMATAALDASYYGNPNGGADTGEKFVYLNFFGTAGTTFDEIVFSNKSVATGFESDNWSVESSQVAPPYPGTPIAGFTAVPEPSSMILTAVGLLAVVGVRRRRAV